MSKVFVLDTKKRPLDPAHPGWARKLLSSRQAAVFRRYPFTIILKREGTSPDVHPLRLKIDPGSKTTGVALVNDVSGEVVWAAELTHRGQAIKKALDDRRAVRRSRRERNTRYRQPRFQIGLPVECGAGGRTKYNRVTRDLPKAHWIDAACVGANTPEQIHFTGVVPVLIAAEGRQSRQMCLMNKFGFPRTKPKQSHLSHGFQTGDLVKAIIPKGTYAGTHAGRIAIRSRPSFHLNGIDVHPKYLHLLHRSDGYSYQKGERAIPPAPRTGREELPMFYG